MRYTAEEKLKMERLLEAFGDYLAKNQDVDVAYSEKTGYVRLIIAECADAVFFPIQNYNEMLQMFFYDILCDEVSHALERNASLTNADMDYSAVRERLASILSTLEDRDHAMSELDRFINTWKSHPLLP